VAHDTALLAVEYADADAFAQDYRANLSSGGVFVETEAAFEARQLVVVRLSLGWAGEEIDLDGEIVHIVPPEMAGMGGRPGVAVQFSEDPGALRERLARYATDGESKKSPAATGETRVAPRRAVRVPARIQTQDGTVTGRTRNLSQSGVLIGIEEGDVAMGTFVRVNLRHPTSGEELWVDGSVVREVRGEERVEAVAVHFDPGATRRGDVDRFIESVQAAEHTRRLGGISGPIAELGPQSIVQMLATTAPRGTVVLRHGEEEGLVCFEGGILRKVRLGPATGMKALVRMLSWRDGTFEFHTTVEECSGEAPFPLEAAILDAVRQIDESQRGQLHAQIQLAQAQQKWTNAVRMVTWTSFDEIKSAVTDKRFNRA
jgi:Tfp pilus assembly protein PilZ